VPQNPVYLAYQGKLNEAEDVDRNIFMQGLLTVDA
jgi:hypothetical protein